MFQHGSIGYWDAQRTRSGEFTGSRTVQCKYLKQSEERACHIMLDEQKKYLSYNHMSYMINMVALIMIWSWYHLMEYMYIIWTNSNHPAQTPFFCGSAWHLTTVRRRGVHALHVQKEPNTGVTGDSKSNVNKHGQTMPCLPSPSHHHLYRWYVYHSQPWVVYDIVLPPLLEVGLLKIWHEHGYLNHGYTLFAINQAWGGWDTQTLNTSPMLTIRSLFTGRHLILKLSRLFNSIALWYKGEYLLRRRAQLTNWCWQLHSLIKQRPCRSERSVWGKYPHF